MAVNATANGELSSRAAQIELGISERRFSRLAALGRIRPIIRMGETPRYRAGDVDRLKSELAAERTSS